MKPIYKLFSKLTALCKRFITVVPWTLYTPVDGRLKVTKGKSIIILYNTKIATGFTIWSWKI